MFLNFFHNTKYKMDFYPELSTSQMLLQISPKRTFNYSDDIFTHQDIVKRLAFCTSKKRKPRTVLESKKFISRNIKRKAVHKTKCLRSFKSQANFKKRLIQRCPTLWSI